MIDNSSKFVAPQIPVPQAPPAGRPPPSTAPQVSVPQAVPVAQPLPSTAPQVQQPMPMQPVSAPPPQQYGYSLPAEFVKLPSAGKFYSRSSTLHNKEELEITYMTTKQEDVLSNPSYMAKGTTLEKLIESILVDKAIRASELLLGDRNAILIAARASGYGPAYGINISCGNCQTTQDVIIDLNEIQDKRIDYTGVKMTERGTFVVELPKSKVFVELRLLAIADEAKLAQLFMKKMEHNLPPEPISEKHRTTIVSVDGDSSFAAIADFVSKMPISDSKYLQKRYKELTPDMDFIYRYECESCNHQNEGGIPVDATFFWPDN